MVFYITSNNIIDKTSYVDLMNRFNDDKIVNDILINQFKYKKRIDIDEKYKDCEISDFNEDQTFNPVKYQTRKTIELSKEKIAEFKSKLASLDYKTIKYTQGELSFEEFEKVKEECKYYRNEINSLENMLKNS